MHEGDERALFVVLEGRIEVVKHIDGIERVLGERLPGTIFGEVPITLGTPFPSGFRAAAAVARHARRGTGLLRGRLGSARAGGRRRRARTQAHRRAAGASTAEPPQPRALVVGHRWDAAASELRRFLDRNQITFEWIAPDAPDAAERWSGDPPPDGDRPRSA